MRYGIFSDVHSNLEALEAVVQTYRKEKIDAYLCVGDVVGYASNPKECINIVCSLGAVTVAGNHDWATTGSFPLEYFNPYARDAVLWTKRVIDKKGMDFLNALKLTYQNEDLTLVHATLHNPQDFDYMTDESAAKKSFALLKANVCFVGHTHSPGVFIKDKNGRVHYSDAGFTALSPGYTYIVNAGSVGQPRDGNPRASYCIFDTEEKEIQIKRISYDAESVRKKIIRSGLPVFLGDRLLAGQ